VQLKRVKKYHVLYVGVNYLIRMNKIFKKLHLPELHNKRTFKPKGMCSTDKCRHMHQRGKMQAKDTTQMYISNKRTFTRMPVTCTHKQGLK